MGRGKRFYLLAFRSRVLSIGTEFRFVSGSIGTEFRFAILPETIEQEATERSGRP